MSLEGPKNPFEGQSEAEGIEVGETDEFSSEDIKRMVAERAAGSEDNESVPKESGPASRGAAGRATDRAWHEETLGKGVSADQLAGNEDNGSKAA